MVEHLLAKERVESSNLFIRLMDKFSRVVILDVLMHIILVNSLRVDLCICRADLLVDINVLPELAAK